MRKITKKGDYIFKQDGVPAHTAIVVQECLGSNMNFLPKDLWHPQSPGFNPIEYSVWAHVECKACDVRHNRADELKTTVNCVWVGMRKDYVLKCARSSGLACSACSLSRADTLINIIISTYNEMFGR